MPLNIPDLEIEYPVITSGVCATPEDQAWFDEHQKGKPVLTETP